MQDRGRQQRTQNCRQENWIVEVTGDHVHLERVSSAHVWNVSTRNVQAIYGGAWNCQYALNCKMERPYANMLKTVPMTEAPRSRLPVVSQVVIPESAVESSQALVARSFKWELETSSCRGSSNDMTPKLLILLRTLVKTMSQIGLTYKEHKK
ncbi:hypothetical protein M413DRAFT_448458 [Hebeloma cylindrosporum]|uniref:Uncharacterized protein n=1 Tax=Hebeloma cylindrosporum TaxID=76867 RepID=A0A0C2XHP9_HEBCY|nr:hypothetical protein M413DRAFT_448458 [Hebeloma cylindrosporum h7]